MYLTWGASLLVLIATIAGVQGQRQAIKTVGKDSVPSIVVAQRLKDALAGMDANAAKELLIKPGQNSDATKDYEERRQQFANRLVAAAENITYGDTERVPIQTLQLASENYIAKLQQARDFHERGETKAIVAHRAAAEIADKTLLPAADALDKANLEVLERTYAEQKLTKTWSLVFVVFSGLALIGVLVAIQLLLSHRMRRTLNPMLLAATAIAVIFLGYTTRAFLSASQNLKVAKEDAFASMHELRQARALMYSINGDQSRYLLDRAMASTYEQAFFNKANRIAMPNGQIATTLAALAQGERMNGTGFLADELNNVTFPGEREAAMANLSAFGTYLAIDQQIRQLEKSGKHQEAIALAVGKSPGQSYWAFDQFRKANQKTFDINQQFFDQAIKQGSQDTAGFEIITPMALLSVALLTLFGLLPRLKEYSL